jgi:hypothetical protein
VREYFILLGELLAEEGVQRAAQKLSQYVERVVHLRKKNRKKSRIHFSKYDYFSNEKSKPSLRFV